MKNRLIPIVFSLILMCVVSGAFQQAQAQKRYAFGDRTKIALTSALTVSVSPAATLSLYTLTADTNVTFNAVTTYAVTADQIVFRIKGNTRQRIIAWGTNLDSPNDTIATNKTWTYSFIWDGAAYKKLCKAATD